LFLYSFIDRKISVGQATIQKTHELLNNEESGSCKISKRIAIYSWRNWGKRRKISTILTETTQIKTTGFTQQNVTLGGTKQLSVFKVCESAHHHTIQINHQLDATISPVYYLTFIYSSTCCWSWSGRLTGSTTTNSTAITTLRR